jgi:hypothetical protein
MNANERTPKCCIRVYLRSLRGHPERGTRIALKDKRVELSMDIVVIGSALIASFGAAFVLQKVALQALLRAMFLDRSAEPR